MRLNIGMRSLLPAVGQANEATRERWLEATLARIPAGLKILDAGAGTQRYKRFCAHLRYISQDFGQYDGLSDGVGLHTGQFDYGKLDIVSDIAAIPEPDRSFDAVMCIEVLEHVPDPVRVIVEFSRLLKTDGYLILTAPFCSLTHFAPHHFSTGFNRYWYERHLLGNGFRIIEITPNGNFFEYLAQEVYRIPSVSHRYAETGLRPWDLAAMYFTQRMLRRLSRSGNTSSELLCYGYQVLARKL